MRAWLLVGLALALTGLSGTGCRRAGEREAGEVGEADRGPDGHADQEAAQMVVELFAENRELKDRVDSLVQEVEALQRQLAETMASLDGARLEAGRGARAAVAPPADVMVDDLTRVRVLDVNRDMGVVVVSGGKRAGMKTGMRFHVLRGERLIGQVRLIDVRDTVAGGIMEQMEKDGLPETGDRVILSSKQDR